MTTDTVTIQGLVGPDDVTGRQIAQELRDGLLNLDTSIPDTEVQIQQPNKTAQSGGALLIIGMGFLCHFVGVGLGVVLEHVWKKHGKPIELRFPDGTVLTYTGTNDQFEATLKRLTGAS